MAIDSALLDEAEQVLQSIRRQDAAAQRLRRVVEMSGPAALAKAVEVARGDPHMPAKESHTLMRERRLTSCAKRRSQKSILRGLVMHGTRNMCVLCVTTGFARKIKVNPVQAWA